MYTGPVNAIDVAATIANLPKCEYTPEDCPTAVWWDNPLDENSTRVCMACVVFTEGCGVIGQEDVDFVALNGTDAYSTQCYLGNKDIEEDVKGRVSIMQRAVEKAYEVASQDKDTLKIFVAPEFFWRGPMGSYPFDSIDNPGVEGEFNAINEIGRALEGIIQQEKFSDWMFLFGTIIASKETTLETPEDGDSKRAIEKNGKMFQFLNFAPLYKGFDPAKTNSDGMKFIVPKIEVSTMDFLTEDRAPNPKDEGYYDNVLLNEILDSLQEDGYNLIEQSWFYMNDIAMSVEICVDHADELAKSMLLDPNVTMVPSGGFGEYRELLKPEGAQISLVSSAGMSIKKNSLVLESGGTIFLQDGLGVQLSQEQSCEFDESGGKMEGKWFCSERSYSAHQVYASVGEAEAALRGLFYIRNNTLPEIHLFKPLDIISLGGDDAISDPHIDNNHTIGDMNVTSNDTSSVTNISMKQLLESKRARLFNRLIPYTSVVSALIPSRL
ncbi:hypothetical protein QTG54_013435 [Skeletonema marinoi]|uniref:Uncharacterized protein n=1 Tax=Skeletonema marinoi TaxID=267567 RepID=A0AAD8XXK3_9STRA|nr:hypothetical protein QTG54_013435 [Skeletonema marinoi]